MFLVSAVASAQCTKDTDCKGDRVCEAGKCASPTLPPAPAAPPGSETPTPGTVPAAAAPATGEAAAPAAPDAVPSAALPPAPVVNVQLDSAPNSAAPDAALTPLHEDEPQFRRRSKNAMIGGIAMVSVGPIALLAALAAKNAQERCDEKLQNDYPDHRLPPSERYREDECNDYSVPLYVFGIGGLVLTAAGIPLIAYGAKQVPLNPPRASLRVQPWASPGSGGLRLRLDL